MTLAEFHAVTRDRIPTPSEFVEFARGQGWDFLVNGSKAALIANPRDPLALSLAKMLSREPYRTNVLKVLDTPRIQAAVAQADNPANVVRPEPPTQPEWSHCDVCSSFVYDAEAVARSCPMVGDRHGVNRCPYKGST